MAASPDNAENAELRQWLEAHGFDEREPAVILASREGRADLLGELLRRGADVAGFDRYGNNALWAACYAESEACVRLLVEHDCPLNYRNPSGNSALAYAASSGKDRMVHLLLGLGADPSLQNQDGMTAMDLASTLPSLKMLRAASGR